MRRSASGRPTAAVLGAWRRTSIAASASSSADALQAGPQALEVSHHRSRPEPDRLAERRGHQLEGVAGVDAGRGQVQRAARVGRGHDRRAGPLDGGELAGPDLRRPARAAAPSRRHRRRSTGPRRRARRGRRTRPSTARTGRWARCTWRRWQGSCTATRGRGARAGAGRGRRSSRSASHSCTSRTRRLNALRLGRATDEVAVVLQLGPAAGRVDQHRRVAGQRRHDPPGEAPGVVGQAGVAVQRPAAVGPRAGQGDLGPGRFQHLLHRAVDVALPGVHHAAGEQPHVVGPLAGPRGDQRPAPHRQAGGQPGPGGPASAAPTAGAGPAPAADEPASTRRWWPSARRARRRWRGW